VGQVRIIFASILFFNNKSFRQVFIPKQSANVNANSNSSQATVLSKLLEQRKKGPPLADLKTNVDHPFISGPSLIIFEK
jgi:hypothetical protein